MASKALSIYASIDADVETLLKHHPSFTTPAPGRPKGDTGPLLRSAVVLIHTAWENYVEQVMTEATSKMFATIKSDHTQLPHWLRNAVAERVKRGDPWDIAGSNWAVLAEGKVTDRLRSLNTPNCNNVEALAKDLLGLPSILSGCGWQNQSESAVRAALDQLVHDIRGEIVHKGQTLIPLKLNDVRNWRKFTSRLVAEFDGHLNQQFKTTFGEEIW